MNEKEYVSGEDFQYLGRSYRLKVIEARKEAVKLQRGYLEIYVKNKNDKKRKQNLVYEWYYEKALLHFFNILQEFNKIVKQEIKDIKIRQMKTRWGSCNSHKSYINLNIELIKKPKLLSITSTSSYSSCCLGFTRVCKSFNISNSCFSCSAFRASLS